VIKFDQPTEDAKIQIEDLKPGDNVKGGFVRSGRFGVDSQLQLGSANDQGTVKRILLLSPLIISGIVTSGGFASLVFGGWLIVSVAIIGGVAAFLFGGITRMMKSSDDDMERSE
jgi:hypothetical protein